MFLPGIGGTVYGAEGRKAMREAQKRGGQAAPLVGFAAGAGFYSRAIQASSSLWKCRIFVSP